MNADIRMTVSDDAMKPIRAFTDLVERQRARRRPAASSASADASSDNSGSRPCSPAGPLEIINQPFWDRCAKSLFYHICHYKPLPSKGVLEVYKSLSVFLKFSLDLARS